MAKTNFRTAEEYIGTFPMDVQRILEEVRATIRESVPEAEEVISYQIPAFKYHGWVLYISAHKDHYSLSCPPPFTVFDAFSKELSRYGLSKSTVRFPIDEPVPVELIGEIAKFRAEENLERESGKLAAKG